MTTFILPVDADGEVLPHNHPELDDEQFVARGIPSQHICFDQNIGKNRLSSAVFKNAAPPEYKSIDSVCCMVANNFNLLDRYQNESWLGAIQTQIGQLRNCFSGAGDVCVGMVPMPENKCHGGIWGKISNKKPKQILAQSEWLVEIEGVEIST